MPFHVINSECAVDGVGMKKTVKINTVFLSTFYPLFFQLYNEIIHKRFGFNICLNFIFNFLIGMLHSGVIILAVYFSNGFIRQIYQLTR